MFINLKILNYKITQITDYCGHDDLIYHIPLHNWSTLETTLDMEMSLVCCWFTNHNYAGHVWFWSLETFISYDGSGNYYNFAPATSTLLEEVEGRLRRIFFPPEWVSWSVVHQTVKKKVRNQIKFGTAGHWSVNIRL